MAIKNYYTSERHQTLLDLINAKYQKEMVHLHARVESSLFQTDNIITHLNNIGYVVTTGETYQVYLAMLSGVNRVDLPEWKVEVKEHMSKLGAEYYDLLSTALSTRHTLTLVFKLDEVYYTIASAFSNEKHSIPMYNQTLATMLLDCKDNADLVLRITDAIQNTTDLELINEELIMISKYKMQGAINSITSLCEISMKAEHSDDRIAELKNKIARYTNTIAQLEKDLRELMLKQFALSTMSNQDELIIDLQEYLMDISEDILDIHATVNQNDLNELKITMQSYMYIPEADSDFFKPNAIQSPNHMLHNKPIATKVLQAVMNQEIRLPLTASYRMVTEINAKVCALNGIPNWSTSSRNPNTRDYLTNHHIDNYSCFDGYKRMMVNAYNDNNFIAFFETMRQCTATINVFDSTVAYHIIKAVEWYKGPILVKTDEGWKNINMEEYLNENTQTE